MAKFSVLLIFVLLQITFTATFAETIESPSVEPSLLVLLRRRSHPSHAHETTAELPILPVKDRKTPSTTQEENVHESPSAMHLLRAKISPTRTKHTVLTEDGTAEEGSKDRVKRCLTCGMDMGNANPNSLDIGMSPDMSSSEKMLLVAQILGNSGDNGMSNRNGQVFIRQAGNQDGYLQLGPGTYTIAGAMRTTLIDSNMYTLSSYTRLLNGMPTLGVVTLVPMQTVFAGGSRMGSVNANMNAYGVPNQGTYTIAGGVTTYYSEGIPYTASTYTRFVDGAATYGTITLAGLQTYYNDQLLQPGQNAFGVPNQGTFSLAGRMMSSYMNGNPVVMSTYTRIVDGVATYGTITLGSMQTFYQGRLLAPGENAFGVPNQGTFTLGGPIQTSLYNGYQMTLSTYTRVIDGLPTYGTVTLGTMQTYFQGKLLQPGENAYGVPNVGIYTLQGAMSTLVDSNGYPLTVSTYTKIVNGAATFGTVTLGSMQTFYNGRLLKAGENAYGVPNQGVYTLGGAMQTLMMSGYPYTVSSYTKIVDGVATFGTVTLGSMQTYFNNRLLQPGENAYGVPNQGTYTLPGAMSVVATVGGYPMTVSTYTKIIDGVATFGTISLGSMQTYYNGRLLRQGENAYGVPNVGVYTLPGPMNTLIDQNGYPLTVSSYTRIVDGRATFGAVTQGSQMTYYNGNVVPYGQNPYGVPNQGTYTLPGNMRVLNVGGQPQTQSTYTRIVDGVATYGTITIGQMQTYFVPNSQNQIDSNQFINQGAVNVQPMIISSPQIPSNQFINQGAVNVQPMMISSPQRQIISNQLTNQILSNQGGVQPMFLLPNSGMSPSGNRKVQIVVQGQNPQPFIIGNQGGNSGQFRTEILTHLTNIPVTRTRIVPADDGQFQMATMLMQQGQSFPTLQRISGPMPCAK